MSVEQTFDNGSLLRTKNVSSKILRGLNGAANMAIKSELNFRHGSVLISSNRILAGGYNQSRSKYGNQCSCCLHAEVSCLHNFVKNVCHEPFNGKIKNKKWQRVLSRATIYVVRIPRVSNNLDYLNYSKPCSDCMNILKLYGVKNVIYSDNDNNISINKINDLKCDFITKGNLRINEYID